MNKQARQISRLNGGTGSGRLRLLYCLLMLVAVLVGEAYAESFSEEEVRAVYLYNFAIFAEWPLAAFESPTSPFRYCTLGSQAVRTSLADVLAGERVAGHPLILVDAQEATAWRRCHVLYLGHGARSREGRVLAAVAGAPVLTVGESDAFARQGGMVGLTRQAGHLRTTINREAAEAVGIQISSKLLRLATLVSTSTNGDPP